MVGGERLRKQALALLLVLDALGSAAAHRGYLDHIPNGHTLERMGWPAVGHVAPLPAAATPEARCVNFTIPTRPDDTSCALKRMQMAGLRFRRNPFGEDFERARFVWTRALCKKDSDGDGRSNGEELGDPHCVWTRGAQPTISSPGRLSHPGIAGHAGRLGSWSDADRSAMSKRIAAEQPQLEVKFSAPAADMFYYHFCLMPVILAIGVALYVTRPEAPRPRWALILFEAYLISHVGVFLGNHRWASHHAFRATWPVKWAFSTFAAWGAGGGPVHWAYLHRIHHRTCDQPYLDLQQPTPPRDFWHGRMNWFREPIEHFVAASDVNVASLVPDLLDDPELPPFAKSAPLHGLAHVALLGAFAVGFAAYYVRQTASLGLRECLRVSFVKAYVATTWYFFLPVTIAFQVVMLVIDAVHIWGDSTFEDAMSPPCSSRNNAFLLVPLLGENWHNNHHASPKSATTWVFWYQVDAQLMLLRVLEAVGLVSDILIQPPGPERLKPGYVPGTDKAVRAFAEWVLLAVLLAAPWWWPRAAAAWRARHADAAADLARVRPTADRAEAAAESLLHPTTTRR